LYSVCVLSRRGLCDGPIPRPEESYRLWCVFECDKVKIKTPDTCCEQVGRRGKDYETKLNKLAVWHYIKTLKKDMFRFVMDHLQGENTSVKYVQNMNWN
jgi:hypothetical protein